MEHIGRVTPKDLSRSLKKDPWIADQPGHGKSGIVDALLTGHEVVCHYWTIDPGQHMIMKCVDLTERSPHLADFDEESARYCGKRNIAFLEFDPFLTVRKEEVSAGVWINNRLK